jgi:hypothetical protein
MSKKTHKKTSFPADLPRAGIWEIDLDDSPIILPVPAIFVVEHESYFILGVEFPSSDDIEDLLRAALLNAASKHHLFPKKIIVKKKLFASMSAVARELDIPCEEVTKLPAVTEARKGMKRLFGSVPSPFMPAMGVGTSNPHSIKANKQTVPQRPKRSDVFQFKIMLNHLSPSIWRRIRVPADFSFGELALAIMDAFIRDPGYHLHGFMVQSVGAKKTPPISIMPPSSYGEKFDDDHDERSEYLVDYFGKMIKQCVFTYDFGDNWEHAVFFEGEFPVEEGVTYPQLLAGARVTPPEDCGGVGGYEHLLSVLKNPKHPDYRDMCEWLDIDKGADFDPDEFDPNDAIFGTRKEYCAFLESYDK